jgi:hypothetical protein
VLGRPSRVDPEIASLTFKRHLKELWEGGRPDALGWKLTELDDLHVVVAIPALREGAILEPYHVKLGAEYYDTYPPTTSFVSPPNWEPATGASRWFPRIEPRPSWFGLQAAHGFPDGTTRQLVCFTFTAEYYMVDHSPPEHTVWRQGYHSLAATLNRLQEVLNPPYYQGPSDGSHP